MQEDRGGGGGGGGGGGALYIVYNKVYKHSHNFIHSAVYNGGICLALPISAFARRKSLHTILHMGGGWGGFFLLFCHYARIE